MKKVILVIVLALMVFSISACGGNSSSEIPDVFGLDYTDAIGILEAEGFEVSAIETSVESFSVKLLYPLEKVEKGTVFKIDDYIIDQNGNLNKNYDVFYDEGLVSEDKSVVIYYAKEDYVREEEDTQKVDTPDTQPSTEPSTETAETPTEEATEEATTAPTVAPTEAPTEAQNETGLRSDFKEAMDSYEAFMDEYVAFMKKYNANPSDLSLLMEYATFMGEYAEFVEDFSKWESEDMNDAELAYYLEVQARVTKKLAEIL